MNLDTAKSIVAGARAYGLGHGLKPLAVVVLGAGGHVIAAECEDGASIKRFEIAHGKAYGALSMGMGSRALMVRAEQQAYFIAAVSRVVGALVPVPGGVLVRGDNGELFGAVGISGDISDNDEAACLAGIEAAGLAAQVS